MSDNVLAIMLLTTYCNFMVSLHLSACDRLRYLFVAHPESSMYLFSGLITSVGEERAAFSAIDYS